MAKPHVRKLALYRRALEFYADKLNYGLHDPEIGYWSTVMVDGGRVARNILAGKKTGTQTPEKSVVVQDWKWRIKACWHTLRYGYAPENKYV